MKADALSLGAALASSEVDFFTIPPYQRPYTWTPYEYETLWEDLSEAFATFSQLSRSDAKPDNFFLGPMVFVKNDSNKSFDIIDGQQRTTTIHVLLWYIFKALEDETEKLRLQQILTFLGKQPRLKVSQKDLSTFLKIRETDIEIDDQNKLAVCANYFRKKIAGLTDKKAFSEFLRERVHFIVIVADDYSKAWDLFIGLNGKGVPLNPTDLVKAFVCGRSDVGDEASKIWDEKVLPLKDNSTSFLLFLSRYKASKFISENLLFREFTKLFPTDIRTIDIASFAEIFHLFWYESLDSIQKSLPNSFVFSVEARRSLRVLRLLQRRDITTLLFQLVSKYGKGEIFSESLLKILAAYQMRMGLAKKRSRERKMITWFSSAFKTPDEVNDQKKCIQEALEVIKKTLKADAPDDNTFELQVQLSSYYGNDPARYILQQHEEGTRGDKKIDDFQIEHLMPQTGTEFWYKSAGVYDETKKVADVDGYSRIVNNIGNLFVIDPTTNNEVKNKEYSVKKQFYKSNLSTWSIAITTGEKENWTPEEIKTRAATIAAWAKEYWNFK